MLEAVNTVPTVLRVDLSRHLSAKLGKALHQRTAEILGALLFLTLWSVAVPSAALGSGEAGGDADAGAVGPLVQRLGVKDRKVARRAMRRLVKIGAPAAPVLRVALKRAEGKEDDEAVRVRRAAVEILGALADGESRGLLESLLENDADVLVRNAAAQALGRVADLASLKALARAVAFDDSDYVCLRAIESLCGLAGKIATISEGEERDAEMKRFVEGALPALRGALDDDSVDVRLEAVKAAGRLRDQGAAPAVSGLLRDENQSIREFAAKALGEIANPSAVPYLVEALNDDVKDVRMRVGFALGALGDTRAVPGLISVLGDADRDLRLVAAHGLGNLRDGRAIGPLVGVLDDASRSVVNAARESLEMITGEMPGIGEADDWKRWWKNR